MQNLNMQNLSKLWCFDEIRKGELGANSSSHDSLQQRLLGHFLDP